MRKSTIYELGKDLLSLSRLFVIGIFFVMYCTQSLHAQETKNTLPIDSDLWYLWLDAKINTNKGIEFLVSEELQEIYCCVTSKKYRRFLKKIEKEIREKYNNNFSINGNVRKLNDPMLAQKLLSKAQKREKVIQIKWNATCL